MSGAVRSIAGALALSLTALAVLTPCVTRAQDASCKQVFNALKLLSNTPNHQYFTISGAQPDSLAQTNEMINTGHARYVKLNGLWQTMPGSPREIMKQEEENFKKSKTVCRVLRDEMLDGTATTVYVEQSQTGPISSVGTLWIAKSNGLPVHEEVNTDSGTGPAGMRHLDIRIVYTDVKAPVLEK
jgi:hypothetical protein